MYAEFDFGLVQTNTTAFASGILASGSPTIRAISTADFTIGIICGYASPTSSQAQTISRLAADGRSPASSSLAR